MSWTIGLIPPEDPALLDYFFLALGKALCIANSFEAKCKYMLRMITLTDALESGSDIDAARELVKTIADKMLGSTIQLVANAPEVKSSDLEVLRNAKDSRNYVAHRGADFESIYDVSPDTIREYITRLREHVRTLADGDNCVSKWCYEFCEREPAPLTIQEQYAAIVLEWVFPSDGSAV